MVSGVVRALAAAALLVAVQGGTAAADLSKELFAGVHAPYTKVTRDRSFTPQESGLGIGLEAGWQILSPLSVSLYGRRTLLSDHFRGDMAGDVTYRSRQVTAGARVDLWPLPRRLRFGMVVGRLWERTQFIRDAGGTAFVQAQDFTVYEFHVGVVPVRWRAFELEVEASHFGREVYFDGRVQWHSVGVVLRWRADLGVMFSSGARRSSPAPASPAAR